MTSCIGVTYTLASSTKENESFHDLEDIVYDRLIRTAYIQKKNQLNPSDTCVLSNVNDDFIFWPSFSIVWKMTCLSCASDFCHGIWKPDRQEWMNRARHVTTCIQIHVHILPFWKQNSVSGITVFLIFLINVPMHRATSENLLLKISCPKACIKSYFLD